MKRVICLLNLLCIASLGCCSLNRRINIIVPGHYFGVDALNESRTCDLIINQISEEEYLKADGKNVIQDAINGNYFSIDFSIIYSEDNIEKVVFTNFKDAYNGATGTPICYNDEKNVVGLVLILHLIVKCFQHRNVIIQFIYRMQNM